MNDLSLLSITIVFFLIMDPIGSIGSYLSLMNDVEPDKRFKVLVREMGIVIIAMLIFNYLGEFIFNLLEISETTVRLASGTILFLIGLQILFPTPKSIRANLPRGEPFIIPLAIPLIAGPSLLATVMLYAHMEPSQAVMLGAIFLSALAAFAVFWFAPLIQKALGANGLLALEKLMGMVLVLLAVQRFADGLQQFYKIHMQ